MKRYRSSDLRRLGQRSWLLTLVLSALVMLHGIDGWQSALRAKHAPAPVAAEAAPRVESAVPFSPLLLQHPRVTALARVLFNPGSDWPVPHNNPTKSHRATGAPPEETPNEPSPERSVGALIDVNQPERISGAPGTGQTGPDPNPIADAVAFGRIPQRAPPALGSL